MEQQSTTTTVIDNRCMKKSAYIIVDGSICDGGNDDYIQPSPPPLLPLPQPSSQQQQQQHQQYLFRFELIHRTFVVRLPPSPSKSKSTSSSSAKVASAFNGISDHNRSTQQQQQQQLLLQHDDTKAAAVAAAAAAAAIGERNHTTPLQQQTSLTPAFVSNYIKQDIISQIRQLDTSTTTTTTTCPTRCTHNSTDSLLIRTLQRHLQIVDDLRITLSSSSSLVSSSVLLLFGTVSLHPDKYRTGIYGGKGGFGTLLKGQSKQSSIKTTKNFTSCRNLQGQRLQQVNDTIHLQLVHDWKQQIMAGTATEMEMIKALTNTASGIPGWHLPLPSWSEVSIKKEYKHNQKLLHRHQQQQQQREFIKTNQKQQQEQQLHQYIQTTHEMTERMEQTVNMALQRSLQKQNDKQQQLRQSARNQQQQQQQQQQQKESHTINSNNKRQKLETHDASLLSHHATNSHDDNSSNINNIPTLLLQPSLQIPPIVTMSGNATISLTTSSSSTTSLSPTDNNNDSTSDTNSSNNNTVVWNIHGDSNFCTIGVLVDYNHTRISTARTIPQQQQQQQQQVLVVPHATTVTTTNSSTTTTEDAMHQLLLLYYEVAISTDSGIVQIGWADSSSRISNSTDNTATTTIYSEDGNNQQEEDALLLFQPNSDNGDGVGDCPYSWGYDPSRNIKLHNGNTTSYSNNGTRTTTTTTTTTASAEKNDNNTMLQNDMSNDVSNGNAMQQQSQQQSDTVVIGCTYNISTGEISYSYNGCDLGIAFNINGSNNRDSMKSSPEDNQQQREQCLIPAISLNEGEHVELRLYRHEMQYLPTSPDTNNGITVGDVLLQQQQQQIASSPIAIDHPDADGTTTKIDTIHQDENDERKPPAIEKDTASTMIDIPQEASTTAATDTEGKDVDDDVMAQQQHQQPIDLQQYTSANDLEIFGLQRLKLELIHHGLKCGGTIQERARRLFAIRNIDHPNNYPVKLLAKTSRSSKQ